MEGITGLSVDQTVVVNMQGLVDLVDAIGGVDVNVKERLPIGGDPNHRVAVGGWIEKGRQHLTGSQALWFARSRWSTDDHDRMRRQQCLISALTQQVDARTLLTAYPKIAKALGGNLSTSIPAGDLAKWVRVAALIQDSSITRYTVEGDGRTPNYTRIRQAVKAAVSGSGSTTTPGKQAAPATGC